MLPGNQQFRQIRLRKHRPNRQSASDRLPQRHNIRLNRLPIRRFKMLIPKPSPSPSAPGPHFVKDQCKIPLVANLPKLTRIIRRMHAQPAFALNRLNNNPRRLLVHRLFTRSIFPASTCTNPGTTGPNPSFTAGFPVAEIIASERP